MIVFLIITLEPIEQLEPICTFFSIIVLWPIEQFLPIFTFLPIKIFFPNFTFFLKDVLEYLLLNHQNHQQLSRGKILL